MSVKNHSICWAKEVQMQKVTCSVMPLRWDFRRDRSQKSGWLGGGGGAGATDGLEL